MDDSEDPHNLASADNQYQQSKAEQFQRVRAEIEHLPIITRIEMAAMLRDFIAHNAEIKRQREREQRTAASPQSDYMLADDTEAFLNDLLGTSSNKRPRTDGGKRTDKKQRKHKSKTKRRY